MTYSSAELRHTGALSDVKLRSLRGVSMTVQQFSRVYDCVCVSVSQLGVEALLTLRCGG
jgi:acetolactate synthase regulatory subunit